MQLGQAHSDNESTARELSLAKQELSDVRSDRQQIADALIQAQKDLEAARRDQGAPGEQDILAERISILQEMNEQEARNNELLSKQLEDLRLSY